MYTVLFQDYVIAFVPICKEFDVDACLWHCFHEMPNKMRSGMEAKTGDQSHIYRSKVDSSGRIVLPADVRLRQQIRTGDQVVLIEGHDGLQVKTLQQAIVEAQAVFAQLAPPDVLLSEELIRERRAEAERE
jgi:AbrB family looped-hinge helix DNA binding protein